MQHELSSIQVEIAAQEQAQKANERTSAMASPHEKLTESLGVLRAFQERDVIAVRSADLT